MSYEKEFIDRWVPKNSVRSKAICWKDLREELERRFNIIRPESIVKNYWNSKMRKENKEGKQGKQGGKQRNQKAKLEFLLISPPCHLMGQSLQPPFNDQQHSQVSKLYSYKP